MSRKGRKRVGGDVCIIPSCGRKRLPSDGSARGLCKPCYNHAARMVKAGKTTWDELLDMGLCVDPVASPFQVAFTELKIQRKEIR